MLYLALANLKKKNVLKYSIPIDIYMVDIYFIIITSFLSTNHIYQMS